MRRILAFAARRGRCRRDRRVSPRSTARERPAKPSSPSTAASTRRRCPRSSRRSRSRRASTVAVRSDDEGVLASQIIQEGSHSPGRRLRDRELAAARGARRARAARAGRTPRRSRRPRPSTARRARHWAGVSARVSTMVYNTDKLKPSQLPTLDPRPRRPEVEGQARARADRDRLPADRHRGRRAATARRARSSGSRAIKRNASGHIYPDNEALVAQVNSGQAAARRASTTTTGTASATSSARVEDPLGRALLRARRPRLRDRRLRRRHPRVELAPGRGAEVPRLPRQPGRRRRSSPTTRASSTRSAPASSRAQAARPVRDAAARPDHGQAARRRRRSRSRCCAQAEPALAT